MVFTVVRVSCWGHRCHLSPPIPEGLLALLEGGRGGTGWVGAEQRQEPGQPGPNGVHSQQLEAAGAAATPDAPSWWQDAEREGVLWIRSPSCSGPAAAPTPTWRPPWAFLSPAGSLLLVTAQNPGVGEKLRPR